MVPQSVQYNRVLAECLIYKLSYSDVAKILEDKLHSIKKLILLLSYRDILQIP